MSENLTTNTLNVDTMEGHDRATVLAVVLGLVLLASLALVGAIMLSLQEKEVPELLGYVVTASGGALSAMLATTRTKN